MLTTNAWNIGVISLEKTPSNSLSTTSTGWKFVKLNGVSPTADNYAGILAGKKNRAAVVSGAYDFAVESSLIYRNDLGTTTGAGGVAGALAKSFANALVLKLANPALTTTNLTGLYQVPSATNYTAGRTHKGTRGGNLCAPYTLQN